MFCDKCGQEITGKERPASVRMQEIDETWTSTKMFCDKCGQEIIDDRPTTAPEPAVMLDRPPQAPTDDMRKAGAKELTSQLGRVVVPSYAVIASAVWAAMFGQWKRTETDRLDLHM